LIRTHRYEPHEYSLFLDWEQSYRALLTRIAAIDSSEILDNVRKAMQEGTIPLPQGKVCFAGFDEINPQLEEFLDFLKSRNVDLSFFPEEPGRASFPPDTHGKTLHVYQCNDRAQEVASCARWIREIYREGIRIGVVVPELETYRSSIRRTFSAELTPESVFPWKQSPPAFNISLGEPLAHQPSIQLALTLLSLPQSQVTLTELAGILASPFLAEGNAESIPRRRLELALWKKKNIRVSLHALETQAELENCPRLARIIRTWHALVKNSADKLSSQWASVVSAFLNDIGWPAGDNAGDLYEIQQAWLDCLDDLASLDHILKRINRIHAAEILGRIAQTTIFQPKTAEHTIQVVGLLESSGMQFDHLWVMGCHQDAFPPPPSPNPFLSVITQKKMHLPHSSSERELQYAKTILHRLLQSAPEITFSFATTEDNVDHKISPLIAIFQKTDPPPPPPEFKSAAIAQGLLASLEIWNDRHPMALNVDEQRRFQTGEARGGHTLLSDQSACPFRAFVHHRLHASAQTMPESDYEASERGSYVHRALHLFWRDVRTSQALKDLVRENRLIGKIQETIEETFSRDFQLSKSQPRFLAMEKQRLRDLLLRWLETECTRPDFQVTATEEKRAVILPGLQLNLRIDRIDTTTAKHTLLIDYKTGSAGIAPWLEERLREPQLPLYAMAIHPEALLFAQVRNSEKDMKFIGIAADAEIMPNHREVYEFSKKLPEAKIWNDALAYWKNKLHDLASEFVQGRCVVDPATKGNPCKYCGLETLCRIDELGRFEDNDAEDE
jgi:probable DNA repair protein